MFKTRLAARTVVVALLTVSLLGAASPVVAVSEAAPAGGVQHEYRLIYASGWGSGQVPIPQPPPGVTYIKWETIAISPLGQWSGALLRSDGKMVGFGEGGLKVVATINREFPDARIIDFAELRSVGAYLIFADGTFNRTSTLADRGAALTYVPGELNKEWLVGPWDLPDCDVPSGRFVRFLSGPWGREKFGTVLLRADGRVTYLAIDETWTPWLTTCFTPPRANYVGGTLSAVSGADDTHDNSIALLRRDGQIDLFGGNSKLVPPKPSKGVKYVGVGGDAQTVMAYLRSDGRIVYRVGRDYKTPVKEQPPKLPTGLKYVSLESWWGSWFVMRSDGQAVLLEGGHTDRGMKMWLHLPNPPAPLPKLAKGWRYVSGAIPRGIETAFLVERIPVGQKVATGIEKVKAPKSVRHGKTGKITVVVASRAILDGGAVKVTYKGKTVGKSKVKGIKTIIRIKTKTMKPKGKDTIGVQYLGNTQGKKSAKAKTVLVTRQ